MKIRKGDRVAVIAGKDRGVEGTVLACFPKRKTVLIEGVNVAKRHTKQRSETEEAGIKDKPMPVSVSNVAVISPKDGKPTKVGYKVDGDKKIRVCRRTGAEMSEVSS